LQLRSLLLQQLPHILEQAVRPMEKIDSIRIVQVGGMPGTNPAGTSSSHTGNGATFPEQVMNSALQYQLAKPIVDAVMKDAGLSNEGITGVAQALSGMLDNASIKPSSSSENQT
ncbi:MAG: flotillin family protein, partial [Betaproteobacteria bacterium]|nr:flotillin family protein [Betaproteobacteria bacterium]